jgi:hypothetical protein
MAIIPEKFDNSDFRWAQVAAQVARLESLDKFPFSVEGKRELVFALLTADTIDQAKQIIDNVMADPNTLRCPAPPDLRRLIMAEQQRGRSTVDELVAEYQRENRPGHCALCQGFGIVESINADDPHSIASYCICGAGRARAARYDPYSPDRVNSVRAKLLKLHIDVPTPGPERKQATAQPGPEPLKPSGTDDAESYGGEF